MSNLKPMEIIRDLANQYIADPNFDYRNDLIPQLVKLTDDPQEAVYLLKLFMGESDADYPLPLLSKLVKAEVLTKRLMTFSSRFPDLMLYKPGDHEMLNHFFTVAYRMNPIERTEAIFIGREIFTVMDGKSQVFNAAADQFVKSNGKVKRMITKSERALDAVAKLREVFDWSQRRCYLMSPSGIGALIGIDNMQKSNLTAPLKIALERLCNETMFKQRVYVKNKYGVVKETNRNVWRVPPVKDELRYQPEYLATVLEDGTVIDNNPNIRSHRMTRRREKQPVSGKHYIPTPIGENREH